MITQPVEQPEYTTYSQAIGDALREEMRANRSIILLGEDIGRYGGAFGVTKGLLAEFGPERVIDTPISEATFMGAALGAALTGLRPVVEIMFADFLTVCMDSIVNQIAKTRFHLPPDTKLPIVIRAPTGIVGSAGYQHSQSAESWLLSTPGLRIVFPSTPADAKALLQEALRGDDPVVFFEHKLLYRTTGPVRDYRTARIGQAKTVRRGADVSVIAVGYMVQEALAAADSLIRQGLDVEVIDLRSLVPLDTETILGSVRKTGRAVIVHEAVIRNGPGAEIAAFLAQHAFHLLRSPIVRLGAPNLPIPYSPALEAQFIPDKDRICEEILRLFRDEPQNVEAGDIGSRNQ